MIEALVSLLSGGLTGIIGSAISKYSEFKTRKLELENQVAMANIETQHIELETRANVQIQESEAEASVQRSADAALSASYSADVSAYLQAATGHGRVVTFFMGCVDFIRGLMRPAITLYLIALTSWVSYTLYDLIVQLGAADFDGYEAIVLWRQVIDMVLYLTATAITWWFGSRPASRK